MADNKQMVLMFGVVAVGGYVAYEYYRYSSAMTKMAGTGTNSASVVSALESVLPFMTYLLLQWGGTPSTTPVNTTLGQLTQANVYKGMQNALSAPTTVLPPPTTTTPRQPVVPAPMPTPAPTPTPTARTTPFQLTSVAIPDVNNSLQAQVYINGQSVKLNVIPSAGTVYDSTGTDITATLQSEGVDINALINAFVASAAAQPTPVTSPTATFSVASVPTPDVNNSLKATVVINGQSEVLNVIPSSGSVYDTSGNDVTAQLQAEGISIPALIAAFQARMGVSGYYGLTGYEGGTFMGLPFEEVERWYHQPIGPVGRRLRVQ